ncbi:EAL domain-containing protein [Thiorhodospira sibirica]|uniref:bifunctional diguanylate cyclase/phosphodiesterase n=1 Tax=Thiorhodospira sibirica TaxID=154347 RepID=UPI0002F9DB07|nr:EAL domain-containing protein [Thiorhodospira sibirica]
MMPPLFQQDRKPHLISLKWKAFWLFGAFFSGLFLFYIHFNHQNLKQSYAMQRASTQQHVQLALTGLVDLSQNNLLNLAQLIPALSGLRETLEQEDTDALHALFAPHWASLQLDSDIALALFANASGKTLASWHTLASQPLPLESIERAVAQVLDSELPRNFVDCRPECLLLSAVPVLSEGETRGALVMGRPLFTLVQDFQQIAQADIVLLAPPSGDDEAITVQHPALCPREVIGITGAARVLPLLKAFQTQQPKPLAPHRWQLSHQQQHYEIIVQPLIQLPSQGAICALIITDVGEALQHISRSFYRNILLGLGAFGLLQVLLFGLAHSSLSRLSRVAAVLPGLAEQRFGEVRDTLALTPHHWPDELDTLEHTTLTLTERLESLEQNIQQYTCSLAQKMQELSVERERYELAVAGANDGIWDWNLTTDRVFFSPRWQNILGYADVSHEDSPDHWLDCVHNEDLEKLQRDLQHHLEGATPWLENEHRLRHTDGAYRWVLCRAMAVRNASGYAYRLAGSISDITQRRRIEEQLSHDALHDLLTGLPNRNLFLDRLEQAIYRLQRNPGSGFAVLLLDLDNFKTINDGFGHHFGDQVLVEVANRLHSCLRTGDSLARLGGDEFSILLDEARTLEQAEPLVLRIRAAFTLPITVSGYEVFTSFSVGIVIGADHDIRPAELLRNADTAMYHAKAKSKGGLILFQESMHTSAMHRITLETALRYAIEREEFSLFYQPIVALESGQLTGFEALIRWQKANDQIVSPADFIPLAEETGLIIPLGRWIINEAIAKAAAWYHQQLEGRPLPININVSGRQIKDAGLLPELRKALQTHQLPPEWIKIELTESAVIDDPDHALAILEQIKDMGLGLCMDDFGTGYSSLSQLHTLPFDVVKIDGSFIRRMDKNIHDTGMINAIITMTHKLGKTVVAECVESWWQVEVLRKMHCQGGQGYVFSPPVNAAKADTLVQQGTSWKNPEGA